MLVGVQATDPLGACENTQASFDTFAPIKSALLFRHEPLRLEDLERVVIERRNADWSASSCLVLMPPETSTIALSMVSVFSFVSMLRQRIAHLLRDAHRSWPLYGGSFRLWLRPRSCVDQLSHLPGIWGSEIRLGLTRRGRVHCGVRRDPAPENGLTERSTNDGVDLSDRGWRQMDSLREPSVKIVQVR